jgi:hypothetical protein
MKKASLTYWKLSRSITLSGKTTTVKTIITAFIITLLNHPFCFGQTPVKKIKEFNAGEIKAATVDRLGNFFLVLKKGRVNKYDANCKLVASAKIQADLLEPWFHPSIFLFNRSQKKITRYGRHFENPVSTELDASWAIEPYLVTVRADNHIWILDKVDASLKHINPMTGATVSEFAIDTTQFASRPHFTHIREYQNMLFVLDQNAGILIFSIFGKQVEFINKIGIRSFNFVGEELYYASGSTIQFFDLTTEATREVKVEGNNQFALVTDERIILVDDKNRVRVWETPIAKID